MSESAWEREDEVVRDLDKRITTRAIEALTRSLRLRGLESTWERRITDAEGFTWEPPIGVPWETWFGALVDRGLEVAPVLRLLTEAGVLGGRWNDEARAEVFQAMGWK